MLRKTAIILAELLATITVFSLLYLSHTLWFTNVLAETRSEALRERFEILLDMQENPDNFDMWPAPIVPVDPKPEFNEPDFSMIEPFGLLFIPQLHEDVWATPILSDVSGKSLASGVGHYPATDRPGEVGNFAIAGHRATNGEPFAYFERLQVGDRVYVQTLEGWFEYELKLDKKIQEDEIWVLGDVPAGAGFEPGARLITLTTCDPRWNSYQRWAWWGELVATYPLEVVPAALAEVG